LKTYSHVSLLYNKKESRFAVSEFQGQEEAACAHRAYVTVSVLFTDNKAVKFASAVTQLS